jgi:hypothetical protein
MRPARRYSFGQGLGTALLIPPVYILVTVLFEDSARAPQRSARSWPLRAARLARSSAG